MLKCVIEECLSNNLYVLNDGNKKYEIMLEFYKVKSPKVGDELLINSELLNKNSMFYTQPYSFELNKSVNNKMIIEANMIEFIIMKSRDKIYTLKRIYG